jgi:ABC-type phosphate transport system permease subunit
MEAGLSVFPIRIIFFLVLFPVAFFWLRRTWRILKNRDFSEVALKKGVPPDNAERWAPYELAINAVAGTVIVCVIVLVFLGQLDYDTWVAIAGSTLWIKLFASFALGRHAHGIGPGRKDKAAQAKQG